MGFAAEVAELQVLAPCVEAGHLDNGPGVDNGEHGRAIRACREPVAPWPRLWPAFRHLGA